MPPQDTSGRPGPTPGSFAVSGPIDLCYPIKFRGSVIDDAELRYSLRSIEANLRVPIRHLYLFGDMPHWVHGAVHVRMSERIDKALDLKAKYRQMVATAGLSDPFLLLDDDHIFLQPTSEIPVYTRGLLSPAEFPQSRYGAYLKAAYRALLKAKLPTKNYQVHYPMVITKEYLRQAVRLMAFPMVMGSIYGNLVDGPTVEPERDFRVRRTADYEVLISGPFLSFPPTIRSPWQEFFAARFPTPSRWERMDADE